MWDARFTLASRLREAEHGKSAGAHLREHVRRAH